MRTRQQDPKSSATLYDETPPRTCQSRIFQISIVVESRILEIGHGLSSHRGSEAQSPSGAMSIGKGGQAGQNQAAPPLEGRRDDGPSRERWTQFKESIRPRAEAEAKSRGAAWTSLRDRDLRRRPQPNRSVPDQDRCRTRNVPKAMRTPSTRCLAHSQCEHAPRIIPPRSPSQRDQPPRSR